MELALSSFLYQIISAIVLISILYSAQLHRKKATKSSLSKCKLPPGPWNLPIVGSLHHLIGAGFLPHQTFRDLARSYGPVMLLRTGQTDLVVITSKQAAQEVLKIHDANFSYRPMPSVVEITTAGHDVVFSNGPYWRRLRQICVHEILSSKRVKTLASIRQEEVHSMLKLISTYSDKSPVELFENVSVIVCNIVTRAAFGGSCIRQDIFLKIMKEIIMQTARLSPSDLFPSLKWLDVKMRTELVQMYRTLETIMDETIQEHLKKRKQHQNAGDEEIEFDLIDILIKEMENNNAEVPITFDSVKGVIVDMFAAGTDTATTAIEWAMTELIRHPNIMAKVQAEIRQAATGTVEFNDNDIMKLDYLKLVIKETLRLHPPAPLVLRQCKETCQLFGYSIPSGATVVVNSWALGRDPEYWTDAEEFIPERFEGSAFDFKRHSFEFIPFGAGRRVCPGVDFGMAVVERTLCKLLLHFDWKLPDGITPKNVDMTEELGAVCHKKKPLSLIPVLRVPLPDV